jgi:hypothetical protein
VSALDAETEAEAEAAERNRRASFRINDRVGLRLRLLGESEYRAQRGCARTRHGRQQQLNSILAAGESQRGALRKLRDTDPTLAGYLQGLEERLEALLRLLGEDEQSAPEAPTHDVNLSGNGIRFRHSEALARGAHVELALRLFPSRTCLNLIGTVVRASAADRARGNAGRCVLAVDFPEIHPDDRELLIRHVHNLQLEHARRGLLRA